MKFIDGYRDRDLTDRLARQIRKAAAGTYTFMEVCGGHTAAIRRFGIHSLLPEGIRLISGPGCPVCVTGKGFVDRLSVYAGLKDVIITLYGDLMRIPGSGGRSLEKARAEGADVRIVFSSLDALSTARNNPGKKVIFAGIGFETTAPGTAAALQIAYRENISNFMVISAHKIMPPAMEAILKEGTRLNGFICPGHVAAITGSGIFDFIPRNYGIGCVVSGFEPADILLSVLMLISQVNANQPSTEIQYNRVVTEKGNLVAKEVMNEVFESCDTEWRGLGLIGGSGLIIRKKYERHDAESVIQVKVVESPDDGHCICGDILRGLREPSDCGLFGKACNPGEPVGACMVSEEGTCHTWHKYRLSDG
ncbi:MAG: hydrogenase formation protein HypD [Bacteroidales bacterium]|jgi:hydrogenase expression/formation protein HypD|nr:hydrogenase formation protein HypD [Bacteroidales bacterium]